MMEYPNTCSKSLSLLIPGILLGCCILFAGCDRFDFFGKSTNGTYSDTLRVSVFGDYFAADVLEEFQEQYKTYIDLEIHDTNEELQQLLHAGEVFDVVMASDYLVTQLIREERLYLLRANNIPNRRFLDIRFTALDYDFGSLYSIPVFWGTVGLAYHANRISGLPLSWRYFYEPEEVHRGYVSSISDMRFALGTALIYLGYSPNTESAAEIDSARVLIERQKPYLRDFQSLSVEDSLNSGTLFLSQIWGGSAAYGQLTNHNIRFVLPAEGILFFVDNLSIPRNSEKRDLAESFINFMLEPHNMASHTEFSYFANTIPVSRRYIPTRIANGPAYITPFMLSNVHQLEYLEPDIAELYHAAWDSLNIGEFEGYRPPAIVDFTSDPIDR